VKITVGATWDAPGGGKRSYEVSFEEQDIVDLVKARGLTRGQAVDHLSRQGDALVVIYVHSQGGIGDETFRARIAELRGTDAEA
jgi:hypothetical protein